ncbi:MAG: hypothetical protein ACYS32_03010 [Planctomycetota bacterium]
MDRRTPEKFMHILYVYQHFATPKVISGNRSYEFVRWWVKAFEK